MSVPFQSGIRPECEILKYVGNRRKNLCEEMNMQSVKCLISDSVICGACNFCICNGRRMDCGLKSNPILKDRGVSVKKYIFQMVI